MKKYSMKILLYEGKSDKAGKEYEAKGVKKVGTFLKLIDLPGSVGGTGTSGADVEVTLASDSKSIIPIEYKTTIGADFGNPAVGVAEDPKGSGNWKFTEAAKRIRKIEAAAEGEDPMFDKEYAAVRPTILKLIDDANADSKAVAHINKVQASLADPKKQGKGHNEGLMIKLGEIPAPGIVSAWYQGKLSKGADYIQIQYKGLFLMPGSKDPLGINDALAKAKQQLLPTFNPTNETAQIRFKSKSGTVKKTGKYRRSVKPFVEFKVSGQSQSPWDFDNPEALAAAMTTAPDEQGSKGPQNNSKEYSSTLGKLFEWAVK